MCVALIGGMDRLERNYMNLAEGLGIDLRVYTTTVPAIASKIKHADAVVVFTNKVSHQIKKEVINVAKAKGIPVFQYHSCGLCTLRKCLTCIKKTQKEV